MDPLTIAMIASLAASTGTDIFSTILQMGSANKDEQLRNQMMMKAYDLQSKSLDMQTNLARKQRRLQNMEWKDDLAGFLVENAKNDSDKVYDFFAKSYRGK